MESYPAETFWKGEAQYYVITEMADDHLKNALTFIERMPYGKVAGTRIASSYIAMGKELLARKAKEKALSDYLKAVASPKPFRELPVLWKGPDGKLHMVKGDTTLCQGCFKA